MSLVLDATDPRCWQTERLRRHNQSRGLKPATVAEARAMGWWTQRIQARHAYLHVEGTRGERTRLLRALRHPVLDYPKRPTLMAPGRPKRGSKTLTKVRAYGNSRAYAVARLRRDHPELARAVARGELSAHAAAVAAGFRRRSGAG